ncbi:MAG: hypothetical protein U0520_05475 [Candidatus Saccharimonadales bacterium]
MPIFAVLVIIGFKVVQHGIEEQRNEQQTKKDIALLDDAEAKMRALPLPKAEHREYVRSCSVRSVKFTDPGPPNCGVEVTSIHPVVDQNTARQLLDEYANGIDKKFSSTGIERDEKNSWEAYYIEDIGMTNGLGCYLLSSIREGRLLQGGGLRFLFNDDEDYLRVNISCYKRFKKQVYPELP